MKRRRTIAYASRATWPATPHCWKSTWAGWRSLFSKRGEWAIHLLPVIWIALYFPFMGMNTVKSMRYMLPLYPMRWAVSFTDMALVAYLGVFPTAVAFILWNKALRMIPTGRSSNCALMVPILSLAFISLLLKEQIAPMQAVGMAIVLASVFFNVRLAGRSCSR